MYTTYSADTEYKQQSLDSKSQKGSVARLKVLICKKKTIKVNEIKQRTYPPHLRMKFKFKLCENGTQAKNCDTKKNGIVK